MTEKDLNLINEILYYPTLINDGRKIVEFSLKYTNFGRRIWEGMLKLATPYGYPTILEIDFEGRLDLLLVLEGLYVKLWKVR